MPQPELGFTFMKWLNSTLRDQLGLEARITDVPEECFDSRNSCDH